MKRLFHYVIEQLEIKDVCPAEFLYSGYVEADSMEAARNKVEHMQPDMVEAGIIPRNLAYWIHM